MSYRTVRFEPVTRQASKNLPCPGCGKKVRRQRIFEMTLSPFNKNPGGTVRTRQDVRTALAAKAAACAPCTGIEAS